MRTSALRILGAIVIVLSLTLTGCAGLVEKVIKDQTGVDVNTDDGTVKIDTDDGTVQIGGGEVPADFPSDVPLPNGTLTGSVGSSDGWGLTYSGVDKAEVNRLMDALKAAGFTESEGMNQDDAVATSFESDTWSVGLIWNGGSGDDGNVLVYTVSKAS